jgi:putative transposase
MQDKIKHRKRLHLENFDYKRSHTVYFLTLCTVNKQRYFLNKKMAKVISDEIEFRTSNLKEITVFCYCIMPDHLHMLLSLTENYNQSLQNWVSSFKRYTAKKMNELFGIKPVWQVNFYEHIVRKEESLRKIADYVLNNPVRKGIVETWNEYPFSKMVDPLPI